MQFLILFARRAEAQTPTPADLREAEFEAIRGLYVEGSIRQIWLRGDLAGACAIVEASSDAEAAGRVNALPLVRAGVLQPPTIVPLKPYGGFAPRS
jgi:uncharacterized protein YciI